MPLRRILIAEGLSPDRTVAEIERAAAEAGVEVVRTNRRDLDRMSERGSHQGVIAQAEPFAFCSLHELLEAASDEDHALIIALDHVTDSGNLGSIARTAEVAGALGLLVPADRSAAVSAGAYKAASGALAHLAIAKETNLARALEQTKQAGFWVVGAAGDAEMIAWDAPLEGKLVLVLGAEGSGLSRLVRERCDLLVRLPQRGRVESLNVAQATAVLAYEWVRRTGQELA
jgi:23S rRNA (guanosine2251-2'-O)-methyltransferase